MTFAAACDWSFGRSLLLALVAWPVCLWLERGLRASGHRLVYSWLLLSPFLFPELLVGYLLAPHVAGRPVRAELACGLVLLLRSVPIGVVALWGTPDSEVSPVALFVRRLKVQSMRDCWELLRCYWHGPIQRLFPAWGLMFLITFQEFEAAALFGATSWTDWLFTEHAKGLSLWESCRFLLRPVLIQVAVLSLIGWRLLIRRGATCELDSEGEQPVGDWTRRSAKAACVLWFLIGVIAPGILLSRELAGGWAWLLSQPSAWLTLLTEIGTAGLVSLVAGLAAWTGVSGLTMSGFSRARRDGGRAPTENIVPNRCATENPPHPNPLPRSGGVGTKPEVRHREGPDLKVGTWLIALCLLPGFCGGLTVSLLLLGVSARLIPPLISGTPLAWVLALTIWLFPRALLLQIWLMRQTDPLASHLITLLRRSPQAEQRVFASRWWWQWQIEPQVAAVGLLCYWAYLDLTTAALLAPPGMASVVVRLYNFMHFGHSAAMSMEALIVMFLPVLLWGLMMAAARTVRWEWH